MRSFFLAVRRESNEGLLTEVRTEGFQSDDGGCNGPHPPEAGLSETSMKGEPEMPEECKFSTRRYSKFGTDHDA